MPPFINFPRSSKTALVYRPPSPPRPTLPLPGDLPLSTAARSGEGDLRGSQAFAALFLLESARIEYAAGASTPWISDFTLDDYVCVRCYRILCILYEGIPARSRSVLVPLLPQRCLVAFKTRCFLEKPSASLFLRLTFLSYLTPLRLNLYVSFADFSNFCLFLNGSVVSLIFLALFLFSYGTLPEI